MARADLLKHLLPWIFYLAGIWYCFFCMHIPSAFCLEWELLLSSLPSSDDSRDEEGKCERYYVLDVDVERVGGVRVH